MKKFKKQIAALLACTLLIGGASIGMHITHYSSA